MPPAFSENYVEKKKKGGEAVKLVKIPAAGHFDVIDPRSAAWPQVEERILELLGSS